MTRRAPRRARADAAAGRRGRSPGARRRTAGDIRVRPTAARVRDALFNTLGDRIRGATVLELFAGTGALGLEALRRGAAAVVFVEQDARLARALLAHARARGSADRVEVRAEDALAAIRRLGAAGRRFALILMDPPYGQGWIPRALEAVAAAGVLAPDGLVVAEGHWRDRPGEAAGWRLEREARYGETALWYLRAADGS
ncbi:MAG: 16S rRNA (guanine(966)-N(2))-methyltransferase RsmD [Armatimonadota bacterium]|nr:16S rRNA (guanine(966)-N(2))-methyltransferase RsmD [Armatimonadota bacterium]MDR7532406.1 16S rRNA (guanine(966)-N(2))-methyltransferase RsmD [Armatimonadota bacterium]MDR7535333.1 16S rRNA (guanine(966)-N(2))-methyltransferase RsmD [Armatimonadota bacterium]